MPVSLLQFAQQSNVVTGGSNTTAVPFVAGSSLKVVGAATLSNATLLYGAMTACNNATFASNVAVLGTLTATTVNQSNVTVLHSEEITSNLLVSGGATLSNGVQLSGSLTTAAVGATTLNHSATLNCNLTVAGNQCNLGSVWVSSNLTAPLSNCVLAPGSAAGLSGASWTLQDSWGMAYSGTGQQPLSLSNNTSLVVGYPTNGVNYGRCNMLVAGNLGVGSSNPQYPVDVGGTVRLNAANAVNSKLLVLYDPNSADAVATACNFYGMGLSLNTLQYQVPAGGQLAFCTGCNASMTLSNNLLRTPPITYVGANTLLLDGGTRWPVPVGVATYWPLLTYATDNASPAGVMGMLQLNVSFTPTDPVVSSYVEAVVSRSNTVPSGYTYSGSYVSTSMWGPPAANWDLVPYLTSGTMTIYMRTASRTSNSGVTLGGVIVAGGYNCSPAFNGTYTLSPAGTAKPSLLTSAVLPATTLNFA